LSATDHRERKRLSVNTAIFALATGISRVVGFGREFIANLFFGTTTQASAFTFASQLPNLMANLFAQAALSAAFVPVFADLLQQGRKRDAFRLATSLFWIVFLVLGGIALIGILLAGVILPDFTSKSFDGHAAAVLTQIMFPVIVFMGMASVLTGILQSYDEFSIPALSPVLWNGVILLGLFLLHDRFGKNGVYGYAIAWLVATVIQLLFIASALRRIDYRLSFHIDWHDPHIRQVFRLMLPVTIGLGIVNLDALINSTMGFLVNGAAPRSIQLAFLIYMMPQGIFSVAVSTVLFPTLSRQAARRAPAEMRNTLGNGMRQINLLLIPSAAGLLALARPITVLVFKHGHHFNALSVHLTSQALFWFAVSLPFAGLNLIMTRTFFALKRPWLPTKLAAINMTVDVIVSLALYRPLGVAGLVIGTGAANIVMVYLQARRLRIGFNGRLDLGQTVMISARILLAAAATGVLARLVWDLLTKATGTSTPGQVVAVGGAVVAAAGFYVWAISHMRVPEWRQIESMLQNRLRPR